MIKSNFFIVIKGLAIGVVELVPGVSGGTIALILGIYERLILAISNINRTFLSLFFRGNFRTAWQQIDGNFLFLLLFGMILGVFSFSSLIAFLLDNFPLFLKSLFTGLIICSLTTESLKPDRFDKEWFIGFFLSLLPILIIFSTQTYILNPDISFLYLFIGGFISVSAFMLPGISGSFVLLILGLYPLIIRSLNDFNLEVLGTFFSGCLLGLLTLSRIIRFALNSNNQSTKSFFFGLVLFSLPLIWKKIPSHDPYLITSLTTIELVSGLVIGILFIYFLNRIKIS